MYTCKMTIYLLIALKQTPNGQYIACTVHVFTTILDAALETPSFTGILGRGQF